MKTKLVGRVPARRGPPRAPLRHRRALIRRRRGNESLTDKNLNFAFCNLHSFDEALTSILQSKICNLHLKGRPKIFPAEIMPLEDAPKKFTKQVHLRLQAAHFTPDRLGEVQGLVNAFPGKVPLFLCIRLPTGEAVFIETHEKFNVTPTRELAAEADRLFGEETFYAKVDTTLPERKMKAWKKKASNGDDE